MESWILLMLGLAVAATAMPPAQEALGYEEAVSLAIDLYNQEPGVAWAFRLLEAKPQPDWDPSLQSLQELEFTVQETMCPPSEQLNLDKCGFKADGMVKECHGTIISEQGAPVVQYRCETAGEGHIRVRRDNRKVRRTRGRGACGRRCRIKKPLPGGWSVIASVPNRRKHIVRSA